MFRNKKFSHFFLGVISITFVILYLVQISPVLATTTDDLKEIRKDFNSKYKGNYEYTDAERQTDIGVSKRPAGSTITPEEVEKIRAEYAAIVTKDTEKNPSTQSKNNSNSSPVVTLPSGNASTNGNSGTVSEKCKFSDKQEYCVLAPIPGFIGDNNGRIKINPQGLTEYLNNMFKFGIALAGGLAVIMIILGGLQYLSSDAITGKTDGKKRIQEALQGLALALLSWLILYTINPQLLSTKLKIDNIAQETGTVSGGGVPALVPIPGGSANGAGGNYPAPTDGGFDSTLNSNASTPQKTLATTFGYGDSQDNGVGSAALTGQGGFGVLTNDTNVMGISLPQSVVEGYFKIPHHAGTDADPISLSDWQLVRNSAVETTGPNGKTLILPFVDIGPGAGAAAGVGADLTHATDASLGTQGKGEVTYRILPGYYSNHPKPTLPTAKR